MVAIYRYPILFLINCIQPHVRCCGGGGNIHTSAGGARATSVAGDAAGASPHVSNAQGQRRQQEAEHILRDSPGRWMDIWFLVKEKETE